MIILAAVSGITMGWLMNWASEVLPHFSATRLAKFVPQRTIPAPAWWQLVMGRRNEHWFWLHLGDELISGVAFACLWGHFGQSWNLVVFALGYSFFLLIAVIDLKYRLILNVLTYPAVLIVVLTQLLSGANTLSIMLGGLMAFGLFFVTAWLRPNDLGGGDVKLATLIGFTFGFPQLLWALLLGTGTGGAAAIFLLLTGRGSRSTHIPYAPFLCLGAMVAMLFNPFMMRV